LRGDTGLWYGRLVDLTSGLLGHHLVAEKKLGGGVAEDWVAVAKGWVAEVAGDYVRHGDCRPVPREVDHVFLPKERPCRPFAIVKGKGIENEREIAEMTRGGWWKEGSSAASGCRCRRHV
jgi:hypothetical protein